MLAIHHIAVEEKALEWGILCSGQVFIAGSEYNPPKAKLLEEKLTQLLASIAEYDAAIHLFLQMARNQFFWDVNKRMGRFIMNAYLLQQGYLAINLPASRQLEFNENMLRFYDSNDEAEMNRFMRSCLSQRYIDAFSYQE